MADGAGGARQAASGDWALWREACDGRAGSAERLVRRLTPQALGLAIRVLGSREDAEDAVQDAFVRLWRSAPSDSRGAALATYFNTIVLNRCRTVLAARREWAVDADELTALHEARSHAPAPDSAGTASDRLAAALARLPARQRMALAMWAYADAAVPDIAHALEIDTNAAHQLLHRAKTALRAQFDRPTDTRP